MAGFCKLKQKSQIQLNLLIRSEQVNLKHGWVGKRNHERRQITIFNKVYNVIKKLNETKHFHCTYSDCNHVKYNQDYRHILFHHQLSQSIHLVHYK